MLQNSFLNSNLKHKGEKLTLYEFYQSKGWKKWLWHRKMACEDDSQREKGRRKEKTTEKGKTTDSNASFSFLFSLNGKISCNTH
jgi:hypothetical protein